MKKQPRFGPDGSIVNLSELGPQPAPDPRERLWCACGHSLLVHPWGPCTGVHNSGLNDGDHRPCKCPRFTKTTVSQPASDAKASGSQTHAEGGSDG